MHCLSKFVICRRINETHRLFRGLVDARAKRVLDEGTKFSEELKCLRSSLNILQFI